MALSSGLSVSRCGRGSHSATDDGRYVGIRPVSGCATAEYFEANPLRASADLLADARAWGPRSCGSAPEASCARAVILLRSMRKFYGTVGVVAIVALVGISSLSGCTVQTVTVTKNGQTQTSSPVANVPNVDACSALTANTLEALGLIDVEPRKLVDPTEPGCQWAGFNNYVTPTLTLWVLDPESVDEGEDNLTVAGLPVNVWVISDTSGRYVVQCGPVSLAVNYSSAKDSLPPSDALQRATEDVIAAYDCAA